MDLWNCGFCESGMDYCSCFLVYNDSCSSREASSLASRSYVIVDSFPGPLECVGLG